MKSNHCVCSMFTKFSIPAILALATLPIGPCNAWAEDAKPEVVFRIASSEPAPGFIEHHLSGSGNALFVSEVDIIDGSHVESITFFREDQGRRAIELAFTDEGARRMSEATAGNTPEAETVSPQVGAPPSTRYMQLAVLLNGRVITAPRINSEIKDKAAITGKFSDEELLQIFSAVVLGRGSLEK